MEIWIIRIMIFGIFPALIMGSWKTAGWLIEAGYLPGTTDPYYFGYGISQAIWAMLLMSLLNLAMAIINWLLVGLPNVRAKKDFWERRGKIWPR